MPQMPKTPFAGFCLEVLDEREHSPRPQHFGLPVKFRFAGVYMVGHEILQFGFQSADAVGHFEHGGSLMHEPRWRHSARDAEWMPVLVNAGGFRPRQFPRRKG